jgi:hypothetical protein
MLRFLAIIVGLAFISVGFLGFQKDFTPDGLLFGYFLVNPMHNVIHVATGLIALFCGLSNSAACKTFFIIFGIAFLALAGYGFYAGPGMLFDLIAVNQADNIALLVISLVFLYLGFFMKAKRV